MFSCLIEATRKNAANSEQFETSRIIIILDVSNCSELAAFFLVASIKQENIALYFLRIRASCLLLIIADLPNQNDEILGNVDMILAKYY